MITTSVNKGMAAVKTKLIKAIELYRKYGWTSGHEAGTETGQMVTYKDPRMCKLCLGSMLRFVADDPEQRCLNPLLFHMAAVINLEAPDLYAEVTWDMENTECVMTSETINFTMITTYNDQILKSKKDAVALLYRAVSLIDKLEKREREKYAN